jgi:hypothetical protein
MPFELLNPAGLETPVGYSHVAKITSGKVVHVAGQAPFVLWPVVAETSSHVHSSDAQS